MPRPTRLKPALLVAALWIWPAIFNVLNRIVQGYLGDWGPPTAGELLFVAGDWLIYAAVTPFVFWTSWRWPVVASDRRRTVLVHFGWAIAFSLVWAVSGKIFELVLTWTLEPATIAASLDAGPATWLRAAGLDLARWVTTTLPFGVIVYATVAGIAHALTYFEQAKARELEAARLGEQLADARYGALQARLQPHFLFNTLNTIAVYVRDGDRPRAVRMVEQLSELLRGTLDPHASQEVTLERELGLVRRYLSIEQERFEDKMRTRIEVPPELLDAAVPGFALQHLVENAIRHGIARTLGEGTIVVRAVREGAQLVLTVEDDGPGLPAAPDRPGHGLDNTRARLEALYGRDAASLTVRNREEGGVSAELRLPWRPLAEGGAA